MFKGRDQIKHSESTFISALLPSTGMEWETILLVST